MSVAGGSPRVLVTGVTGFVGKHLAVALLERGRPVAGMTRSGNVDPDLVAAGLEVRRGDALTGAGLDAALEGIDVAYYLIHSMGGTEEGFEERDARAARNVLAAAERRGVERIVYLGGLGEADADLSPHLASRQEVGTILSGSDSVKATVLRAAVILGPGSASSDMVYWLTRRLPVMIAPRWVAQRIQPIYVGDVIEYLVGCLERPETAGGTFDIGGPDVMTYRSMMETFAAVMGRRRRIFTVPVLTPKLSAYWIDLVTPVDRGVAHTLIEGLRNEVVCTDDAIRSIVEVAPTPYRVAVAATLDGRVDRAWADRFAADVPRRHVALLDPAEAEARFDLTRPETAPDAIVEVRATRVDASPETVFAAACEIGGAKGWYAANWAWRLRGAMDRLVGGPGLRRRIERRGVPEVGDALDFWRVREIDPPRDLALEAEMKVPGVAFLGFHVREAEDSTSVLIQRVAFEPAGWLGRAYWWALYPIHQLIFREMLGNFARAVESAADGEPSRGS